jgi:DNA polymerase-3 subunit epsilon
VNARVWFEGPLAGADTETTGLDVETDRVVTATVLAVREQRGRWPGDDPMRWAPTRLSWLVDPGVEIPAPASAVHGVSTEEARAKGWPAARAIRAIAVSIARHVSDGLPLVVMNAPYDLTLLDRELLRYGLPSLRDLAGVDPLVIDPLVLDRQVDRYRRGPRNLGALSAHYGVELAMAHTSAADALAALQVAVAIGRRYPQVGQLSAADLHDRQAEWAREQAASYEAHRRRTEPEFTARRDWPLIPRQVAR